MAEEFPDGILNLTKPGGPTSRDVVNQVQRLIRPVKVGHAGTLDPLATGVLLLCTGRATRLIQYLQGQMKVYQASFRFGFESDTDDVTGNVLESPVAKQPSADDLMTLLQGQCGRISQRPPVYSAIKIDGERSYKRARGGQSVKLEERETDIYAIGVEDFNWPDVQLRIVCGSGTYIRSIARDLGVAMGGGGLMTALERTSIGGFHVLDATELAVERRANRPRGGESGASGPLSGASTAEAAGEVASASRADSARNAVLRDALQSPEFAVSHLPAITLDGSRVRDLQHGRRPTASPSDVEIARVSANLRMTKLLMAAKERPARWIVADGAESLLTEGKGGETLPLAVFSERGTLVGVCDFQESTSRLKPRLIWTRE